MSESSGLWDEFLPLCLDPLQPDDARHAISPCLNFQSVKWEHFQEVMHLTSLMQVRVKVLFYFSLWPSSVLPTPPLCTAPSFRCRQQGRTSRKAALPQPALWPCHTGCVPLPSPESSWILHSATRAWKVSTPGEELPVLGTTSESSEGIRKN